MKFDSHIFDRIRVKPGEDRRQPTDLPVCEWVGCKDAATHRAPKGRLHEGEQWRYCLAHVREYNQSYNFFDGMTTEAVLKYQKDAITGHRPTWRMGTGKSGRRDPDFYADAQDPFGVFHELDGRAGSRAEHVAEKRTIRNAERRALHVMGLENDASKQDIKARFKDLVKRHHPDANGGDCSTEDRLVEIIQAYNYLKSVGFC